MNIVRIICRTSAAVTLLLTAGCGHNVLSYFNGTDLSVEPSLENGISAHIRSGQAVHVLMKEKCKVQLTLSQQQKGADPQNGGRLEIVFETGDQTNGYVVELGTNRIPGEPK